MNLNVLWGKSLKTKITITTLFIFLASLWSLSYYSRKMLRKDMQSLLGEQQFSTVAMLAAHIDAELTSRLKALESESALFADSMRAGPAETQARLEKVPTLQSLFNAGMTIVNVQGTVIADVPLSTGRTGINLLDRDSIAEALSRGKGSISRLVMGRRLAAPIFLMTAPIRNSHGKIIGALTGVTNLGQANFLDQYTANLYGKTGGYLLVDQKNRMIVTATDKRRVMEQFAPAGVDPIVDLFMKDFEGTLVFVNPHGLELLTSHKIIPSTRWYLAASLPVAEAFAPILVMQERMRLATLLLSLVAGGLTWWVLKRQMSPFTKATNTLTAMANGRQPLQILPVTGKYEIDQFIKGFNLLMGSLQQHEAILKESETLQRSLLENILAGVIIVDPQTRLIESVNAAAAAMFGAPAWDILGCRCHSLLCAAPECSCPFMDLGKSEGTIEMEMLRSDGTRRTVLKSGTRIQIHGQEKLLECFIDINDRKQAEDDIKHLAFYDPLTRLPNRRLLLDRLEKALAASSRYKRSGALLFIDLDNFKKLNDTLGHSVGDHLLQLVAGRLLSCIRESDTVARFGGDEFVVMMEDLSGSPVELATQAEAVGRKMLAVFEQGFALAACDYHCTASIGITLFAGTDETIKGLMQQADLAMYQAKEAGRNTLCFFNQDMQTAISKRTELETDLSEAILHHQFLLYYQAQITSESRLVGVEALLRWQHPRRGLVSPADFITLAEETGLILPLGHWVLETACAQLAAWSLRPEMSQLTISVNVSARQFHQPDFVDQVLSVLEHSGANPRLLKLELTESMLITNVEDVIARMTALSAAGVGFALDDFGTGFSSLSYLKRLPLDQLKIDQSFVRDILCNPSDAAIVKMIVALGENLGLTVIAEGVETEAQKDSLLGHHCHTYQGYFFSRPLPLDGFEAYAREVGSRSGAAQNS